MSKSETLTEETSAGGSSKGAVIFKKAVWLRKQEALTAEIT